MTGFSHSWAYSQDSKHCKYCWEELKSCSCWSVIWFVNVSYCVFCPYYNHHSILLCDLLCSNSSQRPCFSSKIVCQHHLPAILKIKRQTQVSIMLSWNQPFFPGIRPSADPLPSSNWKQVLSLDRVLELTPSCLTGWWQVQFSSVAQSCPTLQPHEPQHARPPCPSPTPGVVHWVGDAIQPPHPLSSPSPPALNLSQH